ncbi:hypothetical protein ACJ41O_008572 [Fusarium nematophilum]
MAPSKNQMKRTLAYDGDVPVADFPGKFAELRRKQMKRSRNRILIQHPTWYSRAAGVQGLFKGIHLENVQMSDGNTDDIRMFTSVTDQPGQLRHTFEWDELKGNDIIVRSRQEIVPLRSSSGGARPKFKIVRRIGEDRGMRKLISERIAELERGVGHGRDLADVFVVHKVKDTPEEAVWHILRRVPTRIRIVKKGAEKKDLTPESM